MKTPVVVSIVVMLHVAAVGTLVMVQGCGTTQPSVEPTAAPVTMPPAPVPETPTKLRPLTPAQPEVPPAPIPEIGTYTVKSGDSIERIARRFKLSAREITELNNIKDVNRIREGQKLLIPGYTGGPEPKAEPKPRAKKPAPKAETPSAPLTAGGEYVVQSGDYLGKIAVKHGVKIRDLRAINKLTSDKLRPGQKLIIPAGGSAAPAPAPEAAPAPAPEPTPAPPAPEPTPAPTPAPPSLPPTPGDTVTPPAPPSLPATGGTNMVKYPVVSGETVESIAKAFLVSPEAIRSANNIASGAQPAAGSMISIPIPE